MQRYAFNLNKLSFLTIILGRGAEYHYVHTSKNCPTVRKVGENLL